MASYSCKWGCEQTFGNYWVWIHHETRECKKRMTDEQWRRVCLLKNSPKAADSYRYWTENAIHTKPVALSLCVIDALDGIERMEGRSKGKGLQPLYVRTKAGKCLSRPTAIHRYADRLLRHRVRPTPSTTDRPSDKQDDCTIDSQGDGSKL